MADPRCASTFTVKTLRLSAHAFYTVGFVLTKKKKFHLQRVFIKKPVPGRNTEHIVLSRLAVFKGRANVATNHVLSRVPHDRQLTRPRSRVLPVEPGQPDECGHELVVVDQPVDGVRRGRQHAVDVGGRDRGRVERLEHGAHVAGGGPAGGHVAGGQQGAEPGDPRDVRGPPAGHRRRPLAGRHVPVAVRVVLVDHGHHVVVRGVHAQRPEGRVQVLHVHPAVLVGEQLERLERLGRQLVRQ